MKSIDNFLEIANAGQRITKTNYWDSDHAKTGLFYLTWNAGAARLLVPDAQKPAIREMRTAREVIISRGPWTDQGGRDALELLFEDGTDNPFCLHLVAEQSDRMIPEGEQGGGFSVTAWTRGGEKLRLPGKYRVVPELPWLREWVEH